VGRLTEYKSMIETKLIPSDNDFLMQSPSLGLSDKKTIIKIRANQRKLKREKGKTI
jgi:hypothetical protein